MSDTNTWITAFDVDLTQQPNQTFATDGNYTIAGRQFTKINSANEVSSAQIVNGTGLVITPTSTTDYINGTRTLPGLFVALSNVIPNFSLCMPLRVWSYTTDNAAANFDNASISIENQVSANPLTIFYNRRGCSLGLGYNAAVSWCGGNNQQIVVNTAALYTNNNVMILQLPDGIAGGRLIHHVGNYGSDWPSGPSLLTLGQNAFSTPCNVSTNGIASQWDVLMGANRAGGSNGYQATFRRLKIEYKLH